MQVSNVFFWHGDCGRIETDHLQIQWRPFIARFIIANILYSSILVSLHNMLHFELTKDTPYLALSGELWSVFYEYFNRNWPCYKGFLLYGVCCHPAQHLWSLPVQLCECQLPPMLWRMAEVTDISGSKLGHHWFNWTLENKYQLVVILSPSLNVISSKWGHMLSQMLQVT